MLSEARHLSPFPFSHREGSSEIYRSAQNESSENEQTSNRSHQSFELAHVSKHLITLVDLFSL